MRAILTLFLVAIVGGCGGGKQAPLVCCVGPNMRAPMEELARSYQERTGVKVIVQADEARALINRIQASGDADLFVTHDPFLPVLIRRGVAVREAWTIAGVWPVIAVPKGNPARVEDLKDLARPGLRLVLTDANDSISGQIIGRMLQRAGMREAVERNVVQRTLVGRDAVQKLIQGEADACIVWNVVAFNARERVDAVEIPARWRPEPGAIGISPTLGRMELDYVRVTLATLGCSRSPGRARAFGLFVASDEGKKVFLRSGFSAADSARPTLPD